MIVVLISSTEIETWCHLETSDDTSWKNNSLHLYSLKFYENTSSAKYIFQKSFWTLEAAVLRCSTILRFLKMTTNSQKNLCQALQHKGFPLNFWRYFGTLSLQNSSGRLLLSTFLKCLEGLPSTRVNQKIFKRIMKFSEQTF